MNRRRPMIAGRDIFTFEYCRELALAAETAKIDTLLVADHVAMWDSFESTVAHYAKSEGNMIALWGRWPKILVSIRW